MTLPGSTVTLVDAPRRRAFATNTGAELVVGITERGPVTPTRVRSTADAATKFGARITAGAVWDALDVKFAERASDIYVSRVVSSTAVTATSTVNDSGAAAAIAIDAANQGTWGNRLKRQIVAGGAGGSYVIVVLFDDVEVDRSPDLADNDTAVSWSATSDWVRVRKLGANDPVTGSAIALASGADNLGAIDDTAWQAALDRAPASLGPMQVSMPGRYTVAAWTQLLTHARDRNRFALLDTDPTASRSALVSSAGQLRALGTELARHGQLLAPWVQVPGLVAGTGTRLVPPSTVQGGLYARNDATGIVGRAVAGDNATSLYALDLAPNAASWTDTDREALADAGVTVIRNFDGVIQTYDDVTLVDQVNDSKWLEASVNRLVMAVIADGKAIADRHMFRPIDGQGIEIADFKADLAAMLTRRWGNRELYGATARDSYVVNVDDPVNTAESIAARKLRAQIRMIPTESARQVEIEVGTIPVTEAL